MLSYKFAFWRRWYTILSLPILPWLLLGKTNRSAHFHFQCLKYLSFVPGESSSIPMTVYTIVEDHESSQFALIYLKTRDNFSSKDFHWLQRETMSFSVVAFFSLLKRWPSFSRAYDIVSSVAQANITRRNDKRKQMTTRRILWDVAFRPLWRKDGLYR